MTLRSAIRTEVGYRLGDIGGTIFTATEMNQYIDHAIKSLYPTYFAYKTTTTVATIGPLQATPSGCRNIYYLGLQAPTSTRVRLLRQWKEGDTNTFIPKTGIAGQTLVWAWTQGFSSPADDVTTLDMNPECEEVVIIRCMISCLERIVTNRVEAARYFSLTVREGVTEADVIQTLDALHATLDVHMKAAIKLPARIG